MEHFTLYLSASYSSNTKIILTLVSAEIEVIKIAVFSVHETTDVLKS